MSSETRAAVLGALDGTITSFAVVAAAKLTQDVVRTAIVVGTASVVADGMSMGVSEYASSAPTGERHAVRNGVACFLGFVLAGVVPLAAFVVADGGLVCAASFALVSLTALSFWQARATHAHLGSVLARVVSLGALGGGVALGVAHLAALVSDDGSQRR